MKFSGIRIQTIQLLFFCNLMSFSLVQLYFRFHIVSEQYFIQFPVHYYCPVVCLLFGKQTDAMSVVFTLAVSSAIVVAIYFIATKFSEWVLKTSKRNKMIEMFPGRPAHFIWGNLREVCPIFTSKFQYFQFTCTCFMQWSSICLFLTTAVERG